METESTDREDEIKPMPGESLSTEKENHFTWRWRDLLIIILGIAGLLILGVLIFAAAAVIRGENLENLLEPTINQTLALAALEAIALILGIYLFGLKRRKLGWDSVGIRSTSWTWLIISITITLIMIPVVSLITLIVLFLSGQPMENPQLDFLLPEGLSALDAIIMLLLAGIVAPFGEELLFRGVFYSFLRERWGIWIGVIISSLLFGLMHGNLAVGLTGFLLGVVAALVFEYSKSLWTAVIVHAINNSLKITLLYLLVLLGLEI
jgi:membrane protease YdiL (CAAX protease family)